jgi:hypothetical protein
MPSWADLYSHNPQRRPCYACGCAPSDRPNLTQSRDANSGKLFLREPLQVDAGLGFLERTPLVSPEIYRGIRRHLIKRFPYKIFYLVEETTVVILAVVYGGRDPQWIRKRLVLA